MTRIHKSMGAPAELDDYAMDVSSAVDQGESFGIIGDPIGSRPTAPNDGWIGLLSRPPSPSDSDIAEPIPHDSVSDSHMEEEMHGETADSPKAEAPQMHDLPSGQRSLGPKLRNLRPIDAQPAPGQAPRGEGKNVPIALGQGQSQCKLQSQPMYDRMSGPSSLDDNGWNLQSVGTLSVSRQVLEMHRRDLRSMQSQLLVYHKSLLRAQHLTDKIISAVVRTGRLQQAMQSGVQAGATLGESEETAREDKGEEVDERT